MAGPSLKTSLKTCSFCLHDADVEGVYTESFTCSPPKYRNHDESDRTWRNAAGFRDVRPIALQTLAREHVKGTRLAREDSLQVVNLLSEGKNADVCTVFMNGFHGPTLEESVGGRGASRSDEPISRETSAVKNDSELPYEDQIELNKFVVRGSGGEEIRTGEHKIAWSPGSTREHRNSFSGEHLTSCEPNFHKSPNTAKTRTITRLGEFSWEGVGR